MIRAILIDDEPIILKSLKENYNWAAMGVEIIATSEDGDEAFEMICDLTPDLIITDIKMPTISGIELVKLLHKANIYPFVIFATGHGDFEYTREAIRLGAYDYILKPFSQEELTNTIRSCVENIIATKKKMHRQEYRLGEMQLKHYLTTESEAVRATQVNTVNHYMDEHFSIATYAINIITTYLDPETSPTNVNYEECVDLIKRLNFSLGWEQCLVFSLVAQHQIILINYRTKVNAAHVRLNKTNTNHLQAIQKSLFDNLAVDSSVISSEPLSLEAGFNIETFDKAYKALKDSEQVVSNDWQAIDPAQTQKYIHDAIKYIKTNYGQQIKLQDVADSVFLSESHFSALFSKAVGTSFSKYLAKYRVDMAKAYLKKNKYAKIYEVSNHVGYSDARYFSTLFKKTEGMTPSEYIKSLF